MEIMKRLMTISVIKLIILLVFLGVIALGYWTWSTDGNLYPKRFSILSGLLTGGVIGLFQLFLSWFEHRKIEKFENMKILDVMSNRDDRKFYEGLIKKSKNEISVMGVTASRFTEHFADTKGDREDTKVLLSAMSRGVKVRILLPEPKHLGNIDKQLAEGKVKEAFTAIKADYPNRFEFKYFDHLPTHSIFIVDNKCILGPVFPDISSKDTPAVFLEKSSRFAQKYLAHFETEWKNIP
jgi:hypothetical protein